MERPSQHLELASVFLEPYLMVFHSPGHRNIPLTQQLFFRLGQHGHCRPGPSTKTCRLQLSGHHILGPVKVAQILSLPIFLHQHQGLNVPKYPTTDRRHGDPSPHLSVVQPKAREPVDTVHQARNYVET